MTGAAQTDRTAADGRHGFTFGFMTVTTATGPRLSKYLAYWVNDGDQWRVAAYKRGPRADGEVVMDVLPPALPDALVPVVTDPATIAARRDGLIAAKQAFSDQAQQIGLGPAFSRQGWPDAMNLGGGREAGFVIGNEHIGRLLGGAYPDATSPLHWSADDAIVASSGDLGVTICRIYVHAQPDRTPCPVFTIWRRDPVTGVWKYIAE
jgi:hypothetical protein